MTILQLLWDMAVILLFYTYSLDITYRDIDTTTNSF